MDLGFSLKSNGWTRLTRVSLSDIKAAADRRRPDSVAERFAERVSAGKGGQQAVDWVHVLASMLVPDQPDPIDETLLGGSFNPAVARQLMVGERVKTALTVGL